MFFSKKEEAKERAIDWEADRTLSLELSEKRAWVIARIALILAIIAIGTLAFMIPFYKIVPIAYQVDKATGEAMMVELKPKTIQANAAMDRHWVSRYVQIRERYVFPLLQSDFDTIRQLSGKEVERAYVGIYTGEDALDKKLGNKTEITINIVSVTLPPGDTGKAIVRFERNKKSNEVTNEFKEKFVATVSYKYQPAKTFTREREIIDNPLGFKVDGYVVDAEVK